MLCSCKFGGSHRRFSKHVVSKGRAEIFQPAEVRGIKFCCRFLAEPHQRPPFGVPSHLKQFRVAAPLTYARFTATCSQSRAKLDELLLQWTEWHRTTFIDGFEPKETSTG